MPAVLVIVALWGCDDDPPPPPAAPSVVTLEEGGVLVCADPSLRTAAAYEVKSSAATPPLHAANLAGGGLVVDDLDGDGFVDLFLPSEGWLQLYWGLTAEPTFEQPPQDEIPGVDLSMGVGGAAVDVDADGDLDLLVTRWEAPVVLLRNDGGRRFTDITAESRLGGYARKYQSASWGDMDADGDLDLFLGTYGEPTKIDVNEPVADCSDHLADPSELWRNEGDGTFEEVSELLPEEVQDGYVFASGWYDADADGFPELFVSNDDGRCAPSVVLHNEGGGGFTPDLTFHPDAHDMGMAVGDLNGDAVPDFAFTSYESVGLLTSSQSVEGRWLDATQSLGLDVDPSEPVNQVYGWGAEFGDVDNDADLDLAMNFGFWSYYTSGGQERYQTDGLWIQDGGQFVDRGVDWGVADVGVGRGLVFADLNGDGWLDLVKRQLDAATKMYVSRCGGERWLAVRLRDEGAPGAPSANPAGIGARVRVVSGETSQVRWVQTGSSGLYSGSPIEVHFGLADADTVDRIEVVWPDGELTTTEDVAARQRVTLVRARP